MHVCVTSFNARHRLCCVIVQLLHHTLVLASTLATRVRDGVLGATACLCASICGVLTLPPVWMQLACLAWVCRCWVKAGLQDAIGTPL